METIANLHTSSDNICGEKYCPIETFQIEPTNCTYLLVQKVYKLVENCIFVKYKYEVNVAYSLLFTVLLWIARAPFVEAFDITSKFNIGLFPKSPEIVTLLRFVLACPSCGRVRRTVVTYCVSGSRDKILTQCSLLNAWISSKLESACW